MRRISAVPPPDPPPTQWQVTVRAACGDDRHGHVVATALVANAHDAHRYASQTAAAHTTTHGFVWATAVCDDSEPVTLVAVTDETHVLGRWVRPDIVSLPTSDRG